MPDTRPTIATVLAHATAPDRADDAYDAVRALDLPEILEVERVVTAYDLLIVVEFDTEQALAGVVKRLQALDDVARTLTLVHVPDTEEA